MTNATMRPDDTGAARSAPVFFVVCGEVGSSVYRSQVVSIAARLRKRLDFRVVQLLAVTCLFKPETKRKTGAELADAATKIGLPPRVVYMTPNRLDPALSGGHVARSLREVAPDGPFVLHCRGPRATAVGLAVRRRLGNARVIFDCRGVRVEEAEMSGQFAREVDQLRALERRSAAEADAIIVVTRALGDYLSERYGADRARMVRIPSGCDESRFGFDPRARADRRQALGVGERPVFLFSGGYDPWQSVERNAEFFAEIVRARPDAMVLALSLDTEQIGRVLAEAGIPDSNRDVRRVPFEEVPSYMAAADASVVLRDASTVNRVASPVKLAEYAVSGLPMAVSDRLGDAPAFVRSREAGVVVGDADVEQTAGKLVEMADADRRDPERRIARSRAAADEYSLAAVTARLESLYAGLLE